MSATVNIFTLVIYALIFLTATTIAAYYLGKHEGREEERDEQELRQQRRGIASYPGRERSRRRHIL